MSKKIKIILLVLALVVVGGSISIAALSVSKPDALRSAFNSAFNKPYSVVYLTTGEIYVGHLSTFPKLVITDYYILQVATDSKDPAKKTFQLAPLKESLWSPEKIYLNNDQVIFTAPVSADSQVAKTLNKK